jgi:thymidylate synthase (FAD)
MQEVKPKVYLVGETIILEEGLDEYLDDQFNLTQSDSVLDDSASDSERLSEVYGRLCYRSFAPGLNLNVVKVRERNDRYLGNVIKSKHGSIFEHSQTNWIFADVSRVFTHELVRHRVGVAMSQESLRYVRLDELKAYIAECFKDPEFPGATSEFMGMFERAENSQKLLGKYFDLDKRPFAEKKEITSAMRRLAPIGLATTIGWSANFRALRHVIEMRTSVHAEEEIRYVFDRVARICQERWPNIFQDMSCNENGEWVFASSKI